MTTLYHHKTDGGAEYLCISPVEGTDEGDLWTTIVRLDGEPELINAVYEAAPELLEIVKAYYSLDPRCHHGVTHCGDCPACKAAEIIARVG